MRLFLLFGMTSLFVFGQQALYSDYSFRYTVHNRTLGPVNGVHNFEVLVKKNDVISIANSSKGIMLSSRKEAIGFTEILKVISNKKNNYHVVYDKNGFPQEITMPSPINSSMVGKSHMQIYLYDYKNVDNNFSIEENIQKRYFDASYKKWSKLNLSNYTVRCQDSEIDKEHSNGVRIKISDNKIVDLIDEFTLKSFKASKTDRFLTIEEIFKLLKGGVGSRKCEIRVDYDVKYGYPSYIHYVCPKNNIREILLFNLEKE